MLIKPNDLRIGNQLCDKFNQLIIVQEIRTHAVVCVLMIPSQHNGQVFINPMSNTLMDYNSLFPIPLNCDILTALEFEGIVSSESEFDAEFKNSSFSIWFNEEQHAFYYKMRYDMIEIKYLHDLQNLFYQITKQELSFLNKEV